MPFTPVQTLLGGYLLHLSSSSLLTETGRVFGISGIVDNALLGDGAVWRWSTIAGLVAGPVVSGLLGDVGVDNGLAMWEGLSWSRIGLAGILVGLGSRLGSGCTSGHFLCGVSRLSPRSLIATATFFSTALITANIFPAPTPPASAPGYELSIPTGETTVTLFTVLAGVMAAQRGLRYFLSSTYPPTPTSKSSAPSKPSGESTRPDAQPPWLSRQLPYFFHGLTFSLGLIISGMISPLKVLSFLQPLSTTFDPSLAMVVLSGVIPNGIHYYYHYIRPQSQSGPEKKRQSLYGWEEWRVPSRTDIDWRLVVGSVIFGAGWGLAGVCPGPAVVGLGQAAMKGRGIEKIAGWVGAMAGGMALGRAI